MKIDPDSGLIMSFPKLKGMNVDEAMKILEINFKNIKVRKIPVGNPRILDYDLNR